MTDNETKLVSPKFKITKIIKKTRAKFWRDLGVGDTIQLSLRMGKTSGASNGQYVNIFKVKRHTTLPATFTMETQNRLVVHMARYEMRELV